MEADERSDGLIPSPLLAEVEVLAMIEHRPAGDIVREALEGYVRRRRLDAVEVDAGAPGAKLGAREARERILARRKGNVLPESVTIRDLQTHGRS
jgi:predicted transcriptional regulator